jgi:hypothetical protein
LCVSILALLLGEAAAVYCDMRLLLSVAVPPKVTAWVMLLTVCASVAVMYGLLCAPAPACACSVNDWTLGLLYRVHSSSSIWLQAAGMYKVGPTVVLQPLPTHGVVHMCVLVSSICNARPVHMCRGLLL